MDTHRMKLDGQLNAFLLQKAVEKQERYEARQPYRMRQREYIQRRLREQGWVDGKPPIENGGFSIPKTD